MRKDPSASTCTTITEGCGSTRPDSAACGNCAIMPACLCGMIMKMTSSTSKTSISGTTFISTKIPRFEPTASPMSHLVSEIPARRTLTSSEKLLTSFELCGDQANLIDAGAAHDVDGPRDFAKQYIAIAFNESDFLRAVLENLLEARADSIPGGVFVIDLDLAVGQYLHDDSLVLQLLILLLIGIGLRHQGVQTLGGQRCDDHENNQQHEQNVDQRNDVHLRHRTALAFTYLHSH